jgi:hypothetical protein
MVGPWGVMAACPATATTELEDINAGPLGVLAAGPPVATTEVEDVDGGPRGGCRRHVRQRPPPKLKMSMRAP